MKEILSKEEKAEVVANVIMSYELRELDKGLNYTEYMEAHTNSLAAIYDSNFPAPSPLQEAVEFAEWLSANSWSFWKTFPGSPIQEKKSVWINEDESMNGAEKPLPTTPELYQLFIKSKNK